jgi:competence protein ComEA
LRGARARAETEAVRARLARVVPLVGDVGQGGHGSCGRHASTGNLEGAPPSPASVDETASVVLTDLVDDHASRSSGWRRLVDALADHVPPTLRGARWQVNARAIVGIAVGLVVAVAGAAFVGHRDVPEMITPHVMASVSAAPSGPSAPTADSGVTATPGVVVVNVAGLVVAPGVFELPVGSRVIDALKAAGGAQPGVDTSSLNLARVLVDGEQIAVGVPPAPDAGGVPSGGGAQPGQPLDLNLATESDLDGLPGVGPVLAGRILAWREEHGRFTSVDELLEVSGIGTATFTDLAPLVRV